MSNLGRLSSFLIMAATAAACSEQVPSDGFKDLRYGMSLDDLRSKGFECEQNDFYCTRQISGEGGYTLFGKEASVAVQTDNGRLSSINISVDMGSDELISLYTNQFGGPQTFTYRSFGGQSERLYWHTGNRAAIAVTRSLTRGDLSVLGITRSSVEYLGPEATQDLLEEASNNTVQSRDY